MIAFKIIPTPNDIDNTYTWYDSNPATNGGNAGTSGDGTDTEDFINALNAAQMLLKLSQGAWKVLSAYLKAGSSYADAVPGGVIAVQTFGDFQNFNPHLHIIATDCCFYGNDRFIKGPTPSPHEQRACPGLDPGTPFVWRFSSCSKKKA